MPLFRRRRREAERPAPLPEDLPTQPRQVFQALDRHGVDYVTIGGVAVQAYGHVRTTQDVDVAVAGDAANPRAPRRRAGGAARAPARSRRRAAGDRSDDSRALADGANFTLVTMAGPLDVWTDTDELRGSPPWPELRAGAVPVRLPNADLEIIVAGREHLIALKRAAAEACASEAKRQTDPDDVTFLADPRWRR